MREILKLAVIVPYYQRKTGILRRCLASIFAQNIDHTVGLRVIIVDDASPRPAKEELGDIQVPEKITVDVVVRSNGGPGAARNSGLDHVPLGTDFIAFIDSDDTWRNDHLQRAVDALGFSNDVYFSDHLQWAGFGYLDTKAFGSFLKTEQSTNLRCLPHISDVCVFSSADLIPFAVREFIAHMSSIVYRANNLLSCRFDEGLRWGGEDDLFFLDLLFSSDQTCISTEVEVELGLGENIFLGSWSWDSEGNLKRFCSQFISQAKLRRRYSLGADLHTIVTQRVRSWRPALSFFIMRNLLKGKRVPFALLKSLLDSDPLFFAVFPFNIARAAIEWAVGKAGGKPVFTGEKICR